MDGWHRRARCVICEGRTTLSLLYMAPVLVLAQRGPVETIGVREVLEVAGVCVERCLRQPNGAVASPRLASTLSQSCPRPNLPPSPYPLPRASVFYSGPEHLVREAVRRPAGGGPPRLRPQVR
ncbi:hypothetical protein LXA43DRAFT_477311 [Ganoderma leucocontextum]|nr:hypothetical protein LXA43DRAFT_477311 [Ganoderma leucocontextum]